MRTATRPLLPWVVWGVAAIAYAVAIINRSSLAALGPAAQDHFGIDATTLAAFPVIQLIVYAGLQIPVGVMLDRWGSTVLILSGGVLMIVGQVVMATVADVRLAILARVLVGAGDACTFISVMRLLPEWFALRQLATLGQLTGLIGQAGQLISVIPLAWAVSTFGWVTGFGGIAATGLLVTLLATVVLRDRPGEGTAFERMTGRRGRLTNEARSLANSPTTGTSLIGPPATEMMAIQTADAANPKPKRIWDGPVRFWVKTRRLLSLPGVRLSYWVHFTSPFAANVFLLLWGTPFLTGGVGLSPAAASGLLSLTVLSSMFAGLLLGPISSRFIERRVWINVGITLAIAAVWITVILWDGAPPVWVLIVLLVVMPLGGPASMIAFEVSRSHTPRSFIGFGTGLVNTAGFTASLLVILFIGLVLDWQGAGSPENYSLGAFKVAFAVQIPLWALGLTMIVVEQRKTKRWMQEHGRKLR
ncbi:MFS transporter [Leucobacter viscericola]|uniref:Lysosomal dipeptide transporter MFSD1 n=1 Tax=Leucobacter viscericola TaxID=2714935 RepID=A0A6G7XE93_9MICO|nr:MFS transporter [Leucobacter viscericola]QIK62698.1 MFS transporter [Leucobacter viscericola]